MQVKSGLCFKGQLENIVFVGKILEVYKKKFVVLDIFQLAPERVNEPSVVWPYKAAVDLKNTWEITEQQFEAVKSIVGTKDGA